MNVKYVVRFSYSKYQSPRYFTSYAEALKYGNAVLNWRGGSFVIQSRMAA